MRFKSKSSRGQALIIIAFAIMGLVGITGLAVDGGLVFSDRRHAQNAADTASIAGAMAMIAEQEKNNTVRGDPWASPPAPGYYDEVILAAMDMAEDNGYDSNADTNTVEVYVCDDTARASCGRYQGDPNYVQVIISTDIDTFFARVLGITELHNRVQAVALGDDDDSGPLFNGESIIALSHECQNPDNFVVQGGAQVTVTGGGLYVNTSDPECGFTCNSGATAVNGEVTTAGGTPNVSEQCGANITGGAPATNGEQWDFPVELDDFGLEVPSECTGPIGTYRNEYVVSIDPDGAETQYGTINPPYTVLTPGSYWDFPPKKEQPLGSLENTIIMEPGVYCVNNVVKLTETQLTLIGHDVSFFIRDGYAFNLNGSLIKIDAPDTGDYAGYLMIVEPNYAASPTSCTINGNTDNYFQGAIFAPHCNVKINGGSTPTGFESQVIGYTVTIEGNSTINFTYDDDNNPSIVDPPKTGLVR